MINREDMLELSRRMTPERNHFSRVAGAYLDEEGFVDGSFNVHFRNLHGAERNQMLQIAKQVVFSETNRQLVRYRLPATIQHSAFPLLQSLKQDDLKNDALLLTLYESLGPVLKLHRSSAVYLFHGVYDVPRKASDKERLDESEEVYSYLIVAICPTDHAQNPGMPVCGCLYPAFSDRSTDSGHVDVFQIHPDMSVKGFTHWLVKGPDAVH